MPQVQEYEKGEGQIQKVLTYVIEGGQTLKIEITA